MKIWGCYKWIWNELLISNLFLRKDFLSLKKFERMNQIKFLLNLFSGCQQTSLVERTSWCAPVSWQRFTEKALIEFLALRKFKTFTAVGRPLWGLLERLLTLTQAHVKGWRGASFLSEAAEAEIVPTSGSSICAENTKTPHPIQVVLGIEMCHLKDFNGLNGFQGGSPKGIFLWCNKSAFKRQDQGWLHPRDRCTLSMLDGAVHHLWSPKLPTWHSQGSQTTDKTLALLLLFATALPLLVLGLTGEIYCFQRSRQKIAPKMLVSYSASWDCTAAIQAWNFPFQCLQTPPKLVGKLSSLLSNCICHSYSVSTCLWALISDCMLNTVLGIGYTTVSKIDITLSSK